MDGALFDSDVLRSRTRDGSGRVVFITFTDAAAVLLRRLLEVASRDEGGKANGVT